MTGSRFLSGIAAAALFVTVPISVPPDAPTLIGPSAVRAQDVDIDISFFFGELQPHGRWVRHDRYHYVFVPIGLGPDWAPYVNGRWIYTDVYGWMFVSDDPFGWATYHYGRWYLDVDLGWVWVPGTVWAPAWVTWRRGPDYVGWAPLPPHDDGYVVDVDIDIDIDIDHWHFVRARDFLAPDLTVVVFEAEEQPVVFERTEIVGPVIIENNVVVNNIIDIDFIEKETNKKVVVHQVEKVEDPDAAAPATAEGETIQVFAPDVAEAPEEAAPEEVAEPEEVKAERQRQGGANGTRVPSGRSATASMPRIGRFSLSASAMGHSSCGSGVPSGPNSFHEPQNSLLPISGRQPQRSAAA